MFRWQYLFESINLLNGLLALAVLMTLYYGILPNANTSISFEIPPVQQPALLKGETKLASLPLNPSLADYFVVGEQNLFHPERRIPSDRKMEVVIPKPDIVLYGTLISNDLSIAYVEDKRSPYSTAGRGKRQKAVKKGDILGGYTLREIEQTRIILVKGEDKIVVALDDKEKRKMTNVSTLPSPKNLAEGQGAFKTLQPGSSASTATTLQAKPSSAPDLVPSSVPANASGGALGLPSSVRQAMRSRFLIMERPNQQNAGSGKE